MFSGHQITPDSEPLAYTMAVTSSSHCSCPTLLCFTLLPKLSSTNQIWLYPSIPLKTYPGSQVIFIKKKIYSSQFHDFVCLHTYLAHLLFPWLCTYRPICCSQSELLAEYTASFLLLQFKAFAQNTSSTANTLLSHFPLLWSTNIFTWNSEILR